MPRHLLALLAIATASPALAQQADWSGPYVFVSAGAAREHLRVSGNDRINQVSGLFVPGRGIVTVPAATVPIGASAFGEGLSFGGGAGLGFQENNLFYGVEIGFNARRTMPGSHTEVTASRTEMLPATVLTPPTMATMERRADLGFGMSVQLKAGYATGPALFFVGGGLAVEDVQLIGTDVYFNPGGPAATGGSTSPPAVFGPYGPVRAVASHHRMMMATTESAGVALRMSPRYSIGLQARHTDFGSSTFNLPATTPVNSGATIVDSQGNQPTAGTGAIPGVTRVRGLREDSLMVSFTFHLCGRQCAGTAEMTGFPVP